MLFLYKYLPILINYDWFNDFINSSFPSGGNIETNTFANDKLADASTLLILTLLNLGSLLSNNSTSERRLCINELEFVFPDLFIFYYYNFALSSICS